MDVWKTCEDFPKYAVSPEGWIKNRDSKQLVQTHLNQQGIAIVKVMDEDNRRLTRTVGLLVAQAYLARPKNPSYNSIIYLDGDRGNPVAHNLMWRPRWYAVRYHKMFATEPINTSVIIEETGEIFGTLRELCMKYGLDEKYTYVDMLNGERCFHYKYPIKRFNSLKSAS